MTLSLLAIVFGLIFLVWSADWFVGGASTLAKLSGMPPLLIGMLVIGFGTSMPELLVSAVAAIKGNPAVALGNAYGSNISNIGLILGLGACIKPIRVISRVVRRELPILIAVTGLSLWILSNLMLSRLDAFLLLGLFFITMGYSVWEGVRNPGDPLTAEIETELGGVAQAPNTAAALLQLLGGLAVLLLSSHILVWGAVRLATALGISELIIGLTIVALGTSLPELASTLAAIRKGEDDLAVGNVVGSNLFNTLAVIGVAGSIHPLPLSAELLHRDAMVMSGQTLLLFFFCMGFRGPGRINRLEGVLLLLTYSAYLFWIFRENFAF